MKVKKQYTLLYDGTCALCNYWVNFIGSKKSKIDYVFLAQESEQGKAFIKKYNLEPFFKKTIIIFKASEENHSTQNLGQVFVKSAAIIFIMWHLSLLYKFLAICLFLIPKFIRDWAYTWVAQNRRVLKI